MAIEMCHALGQKIVAIANCNDREGFAKEMGAKIFVESTDE